MNQQNQRIIPFLSFTGNAEEAMKFYASVLPGAKIESLIRFEDNHSHGEKDKVLNGTLSFMEQKIMFMDMVSTHPVPAFSWATSFFVQCVCEDEFDAVFSGLSQDGFVMMGPEAVMHFRKCAWVTDKFGVTWQLVWE